MSANSLVLFLGNSLFSDDRIGLELGKTLEEKLKKKGYDVVITEKTGLALLDHLENRSEVVIVDSIRSGKHPVGEVLTLGVEEFNALSVFSPHYAGLPETLHILKALNLNTHHHIHIIAVEVEDPYIISETLSKNLREKFDEVKEEVYNKILLCDLDRSAERSLES